MINATTQRLGVIQTVLAASSPSFTVVNNTPTAFQILNLDHGAPPPKTLTRMDNGENAKVFFYAIFYILALTNRYWNEERTRPGCTISFRTQFIIAFMTSYFIPLVILDVVCVCV